MADLGDTNGFGGRVHGSAGFAPAKPPQPPRAVNGEVEEEVFEPNVLKITRELLAHEPFKPSGEMPPESGEVLTKLAVANLSYAHATRLFDASYDKGAHRFRMHVGEAFDLATIMLQYAFDDGLLHARNKHWANLLGTANLYDGSTKMISQTEHVSDDVANI